MHPRSPNTTFKCSTMSPGNPFILGSRSRVTTSLSVFRQKAVFTLAAYVSHAGFSLLQCLTAQDMLATPGFPCVADAASARHWPRATDRPPVLPCVFSCSQPAAKALPSWVRALLWVLASSHYRQLCLSWQPLWYTALSTCCAPLLQCLGPLSFLPPRDVKMSISFFAEFIAMIHYSFTTSKSWCWSD